MNRQGVVTSITNDYVTVKYSGKLSKLAEQTIHKNHICSMKVIRTFL